MRTSVQFSPRQHGAGQFNLVIEFEQVGGLLQAVALCVQPLNDGKREPITSTLLRRLNISHWVGRGRSQLARRSKGAITDAALVRARELFDARYRSSLRRPLYGPEHYWNVAQIYLAAHSQNRSALREIQKWGGRTTGREVTKSAAAKWVEEARALELLDPTSRGRMSGYSAVAKPATLAVKASIPAPTVVGTSPTERRRKRG